MSLNQQIAKHFTDVFFGGNWTTSNLRENLHDVTWEQATTKIHSFHTIAELVYHINYYVSAVIQVLDGGTLDAKDAYSFDVPEISSQAQWNSLQEKTWEDARTFARLIEQMPESQFWETMVDDKYGSYCRNLLGIIEHCHYHLGQIVMLKQLILAHSSQAE